MFSRTALRSTRAVCLRTPIRAKVSIRPNSTSTKQGSNSSEIIGGGVVGGLFVLGIGYGYYHYSGAKVRIFSSLIQSFVY